MSCNTRCNICERIVFSNSITVTGGTLTINIPVGSYADCQKFCLILIQNIPDTATINMPVGITIGTDTTVYPMVRCDCKAKIGRAHSLSDEGGHYSNFCSLQSA